ncbi:hypothetical protein [Apilactobacillus xinyiensis]|nr:hypothetical protein [Apilactobacillus xinyiensis]
MKHNNFINKYTVVATLMTAIFGIGDNQQFNTKTVHAETNESQKN